MVDLGDGAECDGVVRYVGSRIATGLRRVIRGTEEKMGCAGARQRKRKPNLPHLADPI